MRIESILISLIALVIGSLCILGGLAILSSVVFDFSLLERVSQLIQMHAWEFGMVLFVLGCALLTLCAYACRYGYLQVEMGDFSLHGDVLKKLAQNQLRDLFQDQNCQCEVVVHHAKDIEIFLDLPFVEPTLQTKKLHEVEKTLAQLLRQQAQFKKKFLVHANFRTQ
ncbi:MAG: hypothetical protein JSS62_03465 [Verrucomicrobia bacterium]|nr:hypothetical protein [Verrucomicrobiota bacterium]MBS0645056.1 hypothetical protein [Verrucomicrobiota bacterium]